MPLSQPAHKLLLDENVRSELFQFLKNSGFDVKTALKGTSDKKLAGISKREGRILVTNDQDFAEYSTDQVFAVVWLQLPQNNPVLLVSSFGKLVRETKDLSSSLVVVTSKGWDKFPLAEEIVIETN